MVLPRHKTKIVCTIGPASSSESVLRGLIKRGMNVARLNLSHGTVEEHRAVVHRIRKVADQMGHLVTILMDLPGPKIRVGKLRDEPLVLTKGENVTLTTRDVVGTSTVIPVAYKRLPESISRRSTIYLNDGLIQLRVREVSGEEVKCKVVIGGQLLSFKGVNLPQATISLDPVTEKDLNFIDFGLHEGIDTYSLSFVEKADDVLRVKRHAQEKGASIFAIAKIERHEAIVNIDEILDVADGIMIARGDLGVQIPIEDVPAIQKKLILKANILGLPVITATQMLQSMTRNIRPTRAEVTDVANAILDGTDAVMLSEETAIGKYPVETVAMTARIARSTERHQRSFTLSSSLQEYLKNQVRRQKASVEDVITLNVMEALQALNVRFILTPTHTGSTPRRISRFKPGPWILSFTSDETVHRFSALSYGVHSFLIGNPSGSWEEVILRFVRDSGYVNTGDTVILTQGVSPGKKGGTDSMRVITIS
jgi:pyruvate kinase